MNTMISQKNQSFAYYCIVKCTLVVELFRTRNRRFGTIGNHVKARQRWHSLLLSHDYGSTYIHTWPRYHNHASCWIELGVLPESRGSSSRPSRIRHLRRGPTRDNSMLHDTCRSLSWFCPYRVQRTSQNRDNRHRMHDSRSNRPKWGWITQSRCNTKHPR